MKPVKKPAKKASLHGRAMENLEFIRDTMQRSTEFTAVPGYGGVLMGTTAIGAAWIASIQTSPRMWIATWAVEAALAVAVGFLAMWQKSKSVSTPLNSLPAKKFAKGFFPPILAAGIITILFLTEGNVGRLPAIWLMLYGVAVVTGGAFSIKIVPAMGWMFIGLGALSCVFAASFGDLFMAIGFGGLHLIFGLIIGKNFGG